MNTEPSQNTKLAVFYGLLTAALWLVIATFVFLVRKEDVLAPFINFEDYKTTNGEITSSTIIHKSGLGGSYHFDIKYKYTVSGKEYTSNKVHFINTGDGYKDSAESYIEKYPAGKSVTVHYDPNNPSKSVLEPDKYSFSFLGFIAFQIIMAILFLVISIKLLIRKERPSQFPSY